MMMKRVTNDRLHSSTKLLGTTKCFASLLLALLACGSSLGQSPARTANPAQNPTAPNPVDNLQTVEVHPDDRVTFRFYAPKASTVTVGGDFRMGAPAALLTKDDAGIWTYTTDPLPPDSYTYNFNVDGIGVLDTRSPNFRENPNSLFNFFDMPGPETEFMALKDVPHGRVEQVIYHSTTLDAERRMHVYLPPNFEKIQGKLPVLYLLHGFSDNDISWTSAGKINLILDNLYAEGKIKNMIVVMPSGHVAWPPRGRMSFSPGLDSDPFTKDFLNDIVPFVAKTYPVLTDRDDTAIAGFSMGGAQTLNIALWHPEMFGYVYAISTGYFPDGLKELEAKDGAVMKNVAEHPFKQFVFARGKQDMLMHASSQATMEAMDKFGVHYRFVEMNGAHSFVFSRRFLASAFPELFR
jgi:enterochelin esterase-like enzyme